MPQGVTSNEIHTVSLLPIEVSCMVMEEARDHKDTLKSCSLVCRQWKNCTRQILFRRVVLTDWTSRRYLDVLMQEDRARWARQLIISVTEDKTLNEMQSVLKGMRGVTELELCYGHWGEGRVRIHFHHQLQTVTSLTFHGTSFPSFAAFTHCVRSFTNIRELSLQYCIWSGTGDGNDSVSNSENWPKANASGVDLQLTRLQIQSSNDETAKQVAGWLLHGRDTFQMRTIDCSVFCVQPSPFDDKTYRLIMKSASTLRRLRLEVTEHTSNTVRAFITQLSDMLCKVSALETLQLQIKSESDIAADEVTKEMQKTMRGKINIKVTTERYVVGQVTLTWGQHFVPQTAEEDAELLESLIEGWIDEPMMNL